MFNIDLDRVGAHVLRVTLGLMFIAHSVILKYFTFTLAGTAQYFASIGLPSVLAYVVFAAEAIGGVLLVLNIKTRWVAAALIPVLVGATWVHVGNGWVFSNQGGGWEYPVFLIIATVVVALQAEKVVQASRVDVGAERITQRRVRHPRGTVNSATAAASVRRGPHPQRPVRPT